jgi:ABC-2 type transport system permease protein
MTLALATFRRDFLIWSSYRLAAFWQVVTILLLIGIIYFAGSAIGDRSSFIEEEDGSYVAFILVGLAFLDVLAQGFSALPRAIHDNQRAGTLEPMLLGPVGNSTLLLSFFGFPLANALFRMSIIVGFGVIVLGFWHSANPLSVLLVLVPGELAFLGLGAWSAGSVVLVKEGDPVRLAVMGAMAIVGGAVIPIDALPDWIQALALLFPLTYALSGIREGLAGASPADVAPQILVLVAMTIAFLPTGLAAFSFALRRAKQEGALGEY